MKPDRQAIMISSTLKSVSLTIPLGLRGLQGRFILSPMAKLKLERALDKRGLSKRQFAKRLKVPYHYVFRWFKPGYDPKLSRLSEWAKALGCRVRDLIEESKS